MEIAIGIRCLLVVLTDGQEEVRGFRPQRFKIRASGLCWSLFQRRQHLRTAPLFRPKMLFMLRWPQL